MLFKNILRYQSDIKSRKLKEDKQQAKKDKSDKHFFCNCFSLKKETKLNSNKDSYF